MKQKIRLFANIQQRRTIAFRLLLTHIGVSLIPIIAMGFLFYFTSLDSIQKKVGESTLDKLANVSGIIDLKVESVLSDMKLYRSNASINKLLQKPFQTYQYDDVTQVVANFQSMLEANPIIKSIIVRTKTDHLYRSGEYSEFDFDAAAAQVLSSLKNSGKAYIDLGLQERANFSTTGRHVITLAVGIRNYADMSDLGVMFVDLSPEILFDVVMKKTSGTELLVLDTQMKTIMSHDGSKIGRIWQQDEVRSQMSDRERGYFIVKINGSDNLAVFYTSQLTGWTYLEYYPVSIIGSEMTRLSMILFLAVIGLVFMVWSVSNYISHQISKPINELTGLMTQVENGNFNVSIQVEREDDIGRLSKGFNTMVSRINELIQTIYQQERKKKEIEIEVLQAQINPHFLYNTLSSIKWMAIIHGVESISNMTDSLIQLLKLSLGKYGTMIELQQELQMLDQYMSILNVRYNNGISLEYDAPEDLKHARIPRLILQPIVENAIIHGIESYSTKGKISIRCSSENGDLAISVHDNGKGIDQDHLAALNNGAVHDRRSFSNIGIKNINERIKLYYGQAYGLVISSAAGAGTTVTVRMPLFTEDTKSEAAGSGGGQA